MPRGKPKSGERKNRRIARRRNRPAFIDENQLYSIDDYAAATDQSPSRAWSDVYQGRVKATASGGTKKRGRVHIIGAEIIRRNRELAGVQS